MITAVHTLVYADDAEAARAFERTVADLTTKGAEFAGPITDQGFGRTVMLRIPGAGEMMIYQPRHPLAHDL